MRIKRVRKKILKNITFAVLALGSMSQTTAFASPIPVETLSELSALTNISISRDGDYMVGLVGQKGSERHMLAVWDPRDLSKAPKMTKPDGDVEFIYAEALKAGKILVVARTKWTGALAGCGEGKGFIRPMTHRFDAQCHKALWCFFDLSTHTLSYLGIPFANLIYLR